MSLEMGGWRDLLMQLGIEPADTLAGFIGGIVNAIRVKAKPIASIATAFSGAAIATYVGAPIADIVHLPKIFTAFLVGYLGIEALNYAASMLTQRIGGNAPNVKDGGSSNAPVN